MRETGKAYAWWAAIFLVFGIAACACCSLSDEDAVKLQHAQNTLLLGYTDTLDAHDGDANGAFLAAKQLERGAFCGINGVLVGANKPALDAGSAIVCVTPTVGGDQ